MSIERWNEKASFIRSVADLLRGPYRPNQYQDVMLPMLVLRRLDCVLAPTGAPSVARGDGRLDMKREIAEPRAETT